MSEKYKFHDPEGIYHVTLTVVHWIDLFTRKDYKYVILDSLKYCQQEKGLVVHVWVLMSSHLHMIVSSKGEPLEAILRDFKKHTNREIVKTSEVINESRRDWLQRAFQQAASKLKRIKSKKVWQDGNHPVLLDTNKMINERLDYIHRNPVEEEIVDEPCYYWYSSARDYAGKKGLLEVEMI